MEKKDDSRYISYGSIWFRLPIKLFFSNELVCVESQVKYGSFIVEINWSSSDMVLVPETCFCNAHGLTKSHESL